jgi:protocatechuate 3,4-dioxygenase alpha subunit
MADGRYQVVMKKPDPSSLPDGRVLAPHLHVAVFGRGLSRQVITRLYFPDETKANAEDPVLERVDPTARERLVARHGNELGTLEFDIRLQGDGETPFFRLES